MITRRVAVNLAVFLSVAVLLVLFGFLDLFGNPLAGRTQLKALFPDASGLSTNFDVTYDGVAVGSITSVHLVPKGALVTMALDPGRSVPGDVMADVDLANALGEQQIDLVPAHGGTAPALRSGATVPVNPNGIPASVGQLVSVATNLLNAIPPGDLNSLLHQLALALGGHGHDLRTITDQSSVFAQEFLRYQAQFQALLANSPPVLDAVTAEGPELRQALANTAALAQVLADRRFDLANAIGKGSQVATDLNSLLARQLPNLACLTHDFADLTVNLAQPTNLSNLNTTLLTNQYFFGAVDGVSPEGRAVSLYAADPTRNTQYWLRTRLLVPPAQPQASSYSSPKGLPPTKPAAGCSTEFGNGVGPATQAHPSPPGPGGKLIPATTADAVVRGGQPRATGETAAFVTHPANHPGPAWWWNLLLGLGVVGAAVWLAGLSVPADPSGRGRRRPWRRT